jgi:hypothetical protein
MLMPNATYSFILQAGPTAAHVRGIDVANARENVTLAERLAR